MSNQCETSLIRDSGQAVMRPPNWTCHVFVPLQMLVRATWRLKTKGLFPPKAECRRLRLRKPFAGNDPWHMCCWRTLPNEGGACHGRIRIQNVRQPPVSVSKLGLVPSPNPLTNLIFRLFQYFGYMKTRTVPRSFDASTRSNSLQKWHVAGHQTAIHRQAGARDPAGGGGGEKEDGVDHFVRRDNAAEGVER